MAKEQGDMFWSGNCNEKELKESDEKRPVESLRELSGTPRTYGNRKKND